MKYILVLIIALFLFACDGTKDQADQVAVSESTVEFVQMDFEQTLEKAKALDKLVLVDIFSHG